MPKTPSTDIAHGTRHKPRSDLKLGTIRITIAPKKPAPIDKLATPEFLAEAMRADDPATFLLGRPPFSKHTRARAEAYLVAEVMSLPDETRHVLRHTLKMMLDVGCTHETLNSIVTRALANDIEGIVATSLKHVDAVVQRSAGASPTPVQALIAEVCDGAKSMLLSKNKAYGNSAIDPVRIFSKADPVEQILVRIDDKLSRISRGQAAGEDVVDDLIGYLVLLKVARKMANGTMSDRSDIAGGG